MSTPPSPPGRFYITTPIYYVNDVPHIGHAYTTVAADAIARYHRLKGDQTFFLTGTDEHGAKVAEAAKQAGVSPQQFADEKTAAFQAAWQLLDLSHDFFIRTTNPAHEVVVRDFLLQLKQAQTPLGNPALYEGEYQGLYCTGCERFLASSDLVNGRCPLHPNREPERQSERNWFFRLGDYRSRLLAAIEAGEYRILPEERRNEIVGKLTQGLEDISLSRANVAWGIPLPWDPAQTIYVWFDALLNYYSAAQLPENGGRVSWPADAHLMARDILWFHSVIWPAMLMAAGLPFPKVVFAHGFFTIDGQKMSKSLGNVISPKQLVDEFGSDAARYLLLAEVPFGQDGDISLSRFRQRYSADLAKGVGNLVSRVMAMAVKLAGGRIPTPPGLPLERGIESPQPPLEKGGEGGLAAFWKEFWPLYGQHWESLHIDRVINELIMDAVRAMDRYIEQQQVYKLPPEQAGPHLYKLLESLRQLAWAIRPILPKTSDALLAQLLPDQARRTLELGKTLAQAAEWGGLEPGQAVERGAALFPPLAS